MKTTSYLFLSLITLVFFSCPNPNSMNTEKKTSILKPGTKPSSALITLASPEKQSEQKVELAIGDVYDDVAKGIAATDDGGVLLTGKTQKGSNEKNNAFLLRLDKNNKILWQKQFGPGYDQELFTATMTSDKGFAAAGNITSPVNKNTDAYVVRVDANGKVLWQRNLGGQQHEDIYSIIELSDKSLMLAGTTSSLGEGGDAYFIKLSPEGRIIWERHFGTKTNDEIRSIKELENGHVIGAGLGNRESDIYIIELDSKGNLIQEKFIGTPQYEHAMDIELTGDGGYFICGLKMPENSQYVYIYIAKLSKTLEIQWDKLYPGESFSVAYGAIAEADGSFTIAATTKNRGNIKNDDGLLFNVSSKGETNWEEVFGNKNIEYINSLTKNNEGTYFMTGYITYTSGTKQSTTDINYVKYKPKKKRLTLKIKPGPSSP